ncbi:Phosphatidylserine/phosphatidylglycerophosphate/ cardiolipi n synthase [Roseibacterium elongatum DSM 19469]|uniref:Phospholipase D n=1 Tax=Roseicyclus elongatus DSM 19469 TaxID=1294273 RepID=W8SRD2_9RHOB|nr:phospholipase D-like domain-containing protein [Roseibacterium elongatum]AHM05085.1 Phosphatidylserine/phosphatidylglycerophosphate/ cardiolipi n synthase [Roseibacterium elongatum DSM 19469]
MFPDAAIRKAKMLTQPQSDTDLDPEPSILPLITAAEVYPAMERAFLEAQHEIWAGYRVFDLFTRLRSPEGRAIGDTWFDLITHTLRRGVHIHMALSDFDPIMATALHRDTWRSMRAFLAAAELAGEGAKLDLVAAAHPARVGRPHRLLFWPWVRRRLKETVDGLNALDPATRDRRLHHLPGLARHVERCDTGALRPKKWPPADLLPATHHQKIAVFDRHLLCVGGLDLDERRYDDPEHRRRRDETWHDVQVMVRGGPAVDEAQTHLETFLKVTAGHSDPPPATHLLSTLSRKRQVTTPFMGPKPLRRTLEAAHLARIGSARRLIYLETQFFRDHGIAQALARAARSNPDLRLVLVLPAAPEDVAFDGKTSMDARYGEGLQAAAIQTVEQAFGPRAAICSPVRPQAFDSGGRDCSAGSPIIYVHAKVSIFDTTSAIISSANLNGRSLQWDTEAGIELTDPALITDFRARVLTHWLGDPPEEDFTNPDTAVAAIRARAQRNLEVAPEERKGFLVPHDPEPARAFGRRAPGIPQAMV